VRRVPSDRSRPTSRAQYTLCAESLSSWGSDSMSDYRGRSFARREQWAPVGGLPPQTWLLNRGAHGPLFPLQQLKRCRARCALCHGHCAVVELVMKVLLRPVAGRSGRQGRV
jgi:hypothetical protein